MDEQQPLSNEARPGETMGETLQRQMRELGAASYWEAVALEERRQRVNESERAFWGGVFGF